MEWWVCCLVLRLVGVVGVGVGVAALFDPLVNVERCTESKLVVSTYGAQDGGLIYIQGQGESCKQVTASGTALHEFDFSVCGIQWEQRFKIVVQKNANYQTGADRQLPIFCIADRSDLVVGNLNYAGDKGDDASINMTVKPSAFMKFFKVVSEEEVSGKEVKLTDSLIMSLQLDDQWTEDFDIKARYCVASDIVIVENFCSTDTELFPNFSRFKRGYLMSEFGAFRTTDMDGGSVLMNFSCVLKVCKDDCAESACGENLVGWGRRKRAENLVVHKGDITATGFVPTRGGDPVEQRIDKRQTKEDGGYTIDVGSKVKIVERYSDIQIVTERIMCMETATFIIILIFLSAAVLLLSSVSIVLYRKWHKATAHAREMNKSQSKTVFQSGIGNERVYDGQSKSDFQRQ